MNGPVAVVRADGNARIGGGHLARCRSVAAALVSRGWRVVFATRPESLPFLRQTDPSIEVELLEGEGWQGEVGHLKRKFASGVSLALVDHYERYAEFEQALSGWAAIVAVIDDMADRQRSADLIIDPAPGRSEVDYPQVSPGRSQFLLGPAYAPLRAEWANARPASLDRDRGEAVSRIGLCFGATDAEGLTSIALKALETISFSELEVVLGPEALHQVNVDTSVRRMASARLSLNPPRLAEMMSRWDIAIGAAGLTSWERCCLGLPSIVTVAAPNQRANAAALVSRGAAIVVDGIGDRLCSNLRSALADLFADPSRRKAMSASAAGLCDGLGAKRIADAIGRMLESKTGRNEQPRGSSLG